MPKFFWFSWCRGGRDRATKSTSQGVPNSGANGGHFRKDPRWSRSTRIGEWPPCATTGQVVRAIGHRLSHAPSERFNQGCGGSVSMISSKSCPNHFGWGCRGRGEGSVIAISCRSPSCCSLSRWCNQQCNRTLDREACCILLWTLGRRCECKCKQ